LVDTVNGKVDGAWELSDNLMSCACVTWSPSANWCSRSDAGLRAVNGKALNSESVSRLETRDLQPSIGFASPRFVVADAPGEGLPVIALNVDKVDVEFFVSSPRHCQPFLANGGATAACKPMSPRTCCQWPSWFTAGA